MHIQQHGFKHVVFDIKLSIFANQLLAVSLIYVSLKNKWDFSCFNVQLTTLTTSCLKIPRLERMLN